MARNVLERWAQDAWRAFRWTLLPMAGHEIMRHRSPHQVVWRWPEAGEIPVGPKVCVFVHWDGAGEVRDHVMHQVRSLAGMGVSVLFVTNSGRLRPEAVEALKEVCAGIVVRRNVGYDFGAWREGIDLLNLPRADTEMVLIANDSVYGPLRSMSEMFEAIDFGAADVWGCTESWQSRYHLQSYFVAFSPAVVRSEAWRKYWDSVRPTWSKNWLIKMYEVGLTQNLLKVGFRCRAVWPYQALIRDIDVELLREPKEGEEWDGPNPKDPATNMRRRHVYRLRDAATNRWPLNPTSDLWRQLLRARFPFIKRELLRSNPTHVEDIVEWRDCVREVSDATMAPIEKDLQRTLKNRAP